MVINAALFCPAFYFPRINLLQSSTMKHNLLMQSQQIVSVKIQKVILFLLFLSTTNYAQDNLSYWQQWDKTRYISAPTRYATPEKFKAYSLNVNMLRQLLSACPMEFTVAASQSPVVFNMPMPDGRMTSFRMVESQVMHPDLAAAFPLIKTYSGQGIENPAAMLKISITPLGFHGMILSPEGNVFIDPWEQGNSIDYIVYARNDFKPYRSFVCESDEYSQPNKVKKFSAIATGAANRSHGTQLRNYRLALACTGEYAAFYGGTKAGALAGIVASMNRVNGVYESEVAVRMTLIPNDTLIIYTNATTDPYTNGNGSTMLGENITNCNTVIGSGNYDVGHVFSTGGGGVAYLGVPCTANKAGGVTGSGSPVGDAYDIDYVAHEMGHQFGGSHTFNASTGSCSGNRTAAAAFEPGSGITIMAYAGICTATNDLAPHSIAYFHTYSFDQITTYITTGSGNSCPTTTATGNTPPTASHNTLNYTIPFQTPFVLTASGSDVNGDALTYSWEEYDLGATGNWNAPVGDAPIFRSFDPVSSPSRTFPKLNDILSNTTTIGELLPTYARTLKFRVTVRDNRVGGGGVTHPDDTVRVNVINTTTPFAVTSPNTAVTWFTGQSATVTWNVSSTDVAPINCSTVNILLSVDGGNTFPFTLASATPNDGTQNITVPVTLSSLARVKVEAVGNIFFDISNINFTIAGGSATLSAISTGSISPTNLCAGQTLSVSYSGDGPPNAGNIFTVQLSNSAGSFASPVVIGTLASTAQSGTISCVIPAGSVQGTNYRVRVLSSAPAVTGTDNGANLSIFSTLGATGTISGPGAVCQNQTGVVLSVPLTVNAVSYAWSLPSGVTITAGSGTNSITVSISASAVTGPVTVVPSNSCNTGTTSSAFTLNINLLPGAAGIITGTASVCPGQSGVAYSVPVISGASIYNWTLPSGATITGGTGTNSITVDFSGSAVSGTISVSGSNSCGVGTGASFAIGVQAAPSALVIAAGGPTTVCSPLGVALSFTPVAGVSYQWRRNGLNIAGATSSTYTATQSGSYDVVATVIPVGSQLFTTNVPAPIPDNSCTGASSDIVVSGYNFPVRSSGIYIRINLTHTYLGDLDMFLETPSGQKLGLSDQTGNVNNGGDNFTNTVFADSGAASLPTTGAPYTGLYKPWASLFTVTGCASFTTNYTTFAGIGSGSINPNGTWKLRVFDRFSTDTGRVVNWSIFFPYIGAGCSVPSNALNITVNPQPSISSFTPSSGSAGTLVTISGAGFTGISSVLFNGLSAPFTVINNTQLTATVPAGSTTGLITVTNACGSASSPTPFNVISTLTLNLTVLIEGIHTTGGNMSGVLSPSQSDSITVELHNTSSPYATVYSAPAVLNLSGQTTITLPGAYNGSSYYLVVKHRNSIATWSKLPVLFSPVTNYSFKN